MLKKLIQIVLRDSALKTFLTNLKKKTKKKTQKPKQKPNCSKNGRHICVSSEMLDVADKKKGKERKPNGFCNNSPSSELLYCPREISPPTRFRAILKMAAGSGRRLVALLLHHLVITWRGPNDGAIDLLCQTQQIAVPSPVRRGAARRHSAHRVAAIRSCIVVREEAAQPSSPAHPHLPLAWLFQHCSSSDSVMLPREQISSDRLDQNLLDSFSFTLMSITCRGAKQSMGSVSAS